MNKQRRKELENVQTKLSELKEEIELIQGDEQDAFDNLPEGLQMSEKGEAMESAIDSLDSAACAVDDVISEIDDVISEIDEAIN